MLYPCRSRVAAVFAVIFQKEFFASFYAAFLRDSPMYFVVISFTVSHERALSRCYPLSA
ncbi:hypothetical protein BN2476_180038 [Paraburkholderia piptadeniae]|uniref:Uncharacterized protein n=1 Tax=Paraburkholderia piptadeniae TaxID=1701573 RepID=A0A1N7RUG9_9BURK|nr:hypothetical protein BN2476_180038 [Paraburkholderia piptadeniae]